MFYVLGIAFVVLVALFIVLIGLPWLAQESVLFTTVQEGTIKAIVKGRSVERFIMSFAGYHLNDPSKKWYRPTKVINDVMTGFPDWEVLYHGKANIDGFTEQDSYYDARPWLLKYLGLYWVGFPWRHSVYVYKFDWNETITDEDGKQKVAPRSKPSDFIYVADFTYAIVTEGAETKDLLPTTETTLVTVAIRNPYRALFSGEDWLHRITAAINRYVRSYVGSRTYQALIDGDEDQAQSSEKKDFSQQIIALNDFLPGETETQVPRGLMGRYGVQIRTADLQTVEFSGVGKEEHEKAAVAVYVAKQNAEAKIREGEAEAKVIQLIGDTEAAALEARLKTIHAYPDTGITLAGYDAIRKSSEGPGNTIIWANNPLDPLTGILKRQTGGSTT